MHADRVGPAGDDQRHLRHFGQRNRWGWRLFGQTGRSALDQQQLFVLQRRDLDFRRGLGVVEHGNVQPPGDQPFLHGGRQPFGDRQAGLGQLLAEGPRQRHGQHPRQAGRQANGHPPGERAAHAAQFLARARHLVQDATAVLQQQLAGFGGGGAAAVADQQVLPQLDFQQPHLTREGGLRHVQRQRGLGETAQFGHAHEVFELLQIHRDSGIALFKLYIFALSGSRARGLVGRAGAEQNGG